jgi:uncharacterized protein YutE (UPF0331/DUF86 family)
MQFVRNMLVEQRKRLVGTVMKYIENEVYPKLTEMERRALRKRILTAVDSYHDVCLDMLKASVDDGLTINDEAARLLARLNTEIASLKERI